MLATFISLVVTHSCGQNMENIFGKSLLISVEFLGFGRQCVYLHNHQYFVYT